MVLEAPFGTPTDSKCYRLPVSRCQREPKGRAKVSKSAGKLNLGFEGRKEQFSDGLGVAFSLTFRRDASAVCFFLLSVEKLDFGAPKYTKRSPKASKMEVCKPVSF